MELRFLEEPFIPKSKVKIMLIDGRTQEHILNKLSSFGIDFILTEKCPSVHESLSYHPDIQLHPLGNGKFVVCPELFQSLSNKLSKFGCEIVCGTNSLKSNYPEDIAYNVARIGDVCLHNFKYTDPIIRNYFQDNMLQTANVKQGYSKCSVSILNKSAIITPDKGIHETALKTGIDSLLISSGYVTLEGMSYGFIGGCTGLISPDLLAITGSLKNHPDCREILSFAKKHKVDILFLSETTPVDLGSLIPIKESAV